MENYECDLIWCPLFSITQEEKNSFLEKIKDGKTGDGSLSSFVFDTMYKHGYDYTDSDTLEATKRAILNYLIIKTDFAYDVLDAESYEKAKESYELRQFNSETLDTLIKYFTLAWSSLRSADGKPLFLDGKRIFDLLESDVNIELRYINDEHIANKYAPIKDVISTLCYAHNRYFSNVEDSEAYLHVYLNNYITDTYGYNFNEATRQTEYNHSEYFKGKVNERLQLALVNDKEFWKDRTFYVVSLLNRMIKNNTNDPKAVIDYIFKNLNNDESASLLIKNGLSIGFSLENLKKKLKEYAIFDGFNEQIIYPLFDCDNEIINKGKKFFESFIYDFLYPHCKEIVKERLSKKLKLDAIDNLFGAFNDATLLNGITGLERKALFVLSKEFFKDDKILKRAYIKSYYLSKSATQSEKNYQLLECFYNVIKLLNSELKIETAIQLNTKLRKESFNLLKDIFFNLGVNIEYNDDYVASMVDIKSAKNSEADRFPILQDLGSAIYDFSLAELFFYNPYYPMAEYEYDKYSDYKIKIEIAKKFKLNEAYICHTSRPYKFYYDVLNGAIDFNLYNDLFRKEKYLSDSLDMLLGAYVLDKGHNDAILLAKALIIHTFPDKFKNNDLLFTSGDTRKELINSHLEILNSMKNKHTYYNFMHASLYNLLGNLVLNSDATDCGSFKFYTPDRIAPLFGDTRFFTDITPPFRCYLENGIDGVISEYGKIALKKYNNK